MAGRGWAVIAVSSALAFCPSCTPPLSEPAAETSPAPTPVVGQKGKDVVWVPTPTALVERMLDIAKLSSSDFLIDLGSGDGRLVIGAARRGARAKGIEFNPSLVAYATEQARLAGVPWRATFVHGDIFDANLAQATVVTMFLSTEINLKLRPKLLNLEPGTRIVTNTFDMADWEPDEVARAADCGSWCDALLWVVPAKVGGAWTLDGQAMHIEQTFQRVRGTVGGAPIEQGRLNGVSITFMVGPHRYSGTIRGDSMTGTTDDGRAWRAVRAATGA